MKRLLGLINVKCIAATKNCFFYIYIITIMGLTISRQPIFTGALPHTGVFLLLHYNGTMLHRQWSNI